MKEVLVEDRRYVVCRNPTEAAKDAAARETLLAQLPAALEHSPKSVIGNRGVARFLRVNKDASPSTARPSSATSGSTGSSCFAPARTCPRRGGARVQELVASGASRPRDQADARRPRALPPSRRHHGGHIVGCFLALRLEVDLQRRLDAAEVGCSCLMRDLDQVKAVEVTLDERRYRLRTELRGHASAAFAAAGARPPRVVEPIHDEQPADEMARA